MRGDIDDTNSGSHSGDPGQWEMFNTADTIDGAWLLQGGKGFRTAIFVLAAINLTAAVIMIGNILYDAWTVRKWDFETRRRYVGVLEQKLYFKKLMLFRKYFGWLWKIHPAETFPLIVSGAVVLQSIIVLPVQGLNTKPMLFDGCAKFAQLIWPGTYDKEPFEQHD